MHPRRHPARAGKHGKFPRKAPIVTPEQFATERKKSGFTREQAAEFLGVSLRTIGHWETGKARPAWAAFKLLRVTRNGDLNDPRWEGYSLVRGRLVTPENHAFEPHDLTWLSLLVRRAEAFTELRRKLEEGEGAACAARERSVARAPAVAPSASAFPYMQLRQWTTVGTIFPRVRDFSPVTTGEKGQAGRAIGPRSNTGQKGEAA
ncbi:VC1465 family Xer recombination activation factor [Lysobacter sp. KIS68-7]|uniref:VC1465 family Xer recombination activation factor n=1 Tax=Lysobacter sp. KIS68-7 TaxID=2904252 RepID=UPI001E61DD40|nr:VC1465 family Xer recombination activation factor [Lysobacter sp. KIS68-7]UHQ18949.1 VC1465 family Xer recombination activation factor [Lysobacter sp. KIS68-7]